MLTSFPSSAPSRRFDFLQGCKTKVSLNSQPFYFCRLFSTFFHLPPSAFILISLIPCSYPPTSPNSSRSFLISFITCHIHTHTHIGLILQRAWTEGWKDCGVLLEELTGAKGCLRFHGTEYTTCLMWAKCISNGSAAKSLSWLMI